MSVVALFRCRRCGDPGHRTELQFRGQTLDTFVACDACIDGCKEVLERVRPAFEALSAIGVDRDTANEVMTFLLERWPERLVST